MTILDLSAVTSFKLCYKCHGPAEGQVSLKEYFVPLNVCKKCHTEAVAKVREELAQISNEMPVFTYFEDKE